MNAIVGALLTQGYVDELANSILITVEDDDAGRGARLQQELTDQADAILANTSVNGAILSQTIQNNQQLQQLSDTYGITTGKAALIQTIVDTGNSLHTFEELVGLSINDLNLLYTSLTTTPAEPSTGGGTSGSGTAETAPAIQSSGQASDSAYIGVEAAKSAAFAHAGLDAAQVTMGEVDFDYEDGRMVYELEFYANGAEYEYDIDASTGAVVKSSQEGGRPQTGSSVGSVGTWGSAPSGSGGGTAQTGAGGSSSPDIGSEAALAAALSHAGVSQDQVYGLEVQRDRDDGRLEYEIDFKAGGWEYEYTISAADGAILDYERDN